MEFLFEYGLFLAKTITFVVAVGVLLGLAVSASQRGKSNAQSQGEIEITPLNQHYENIEKQLKETICDEQKLKDEQKAAKKQKKEEKKKLKKNKQADDIDEEAKKRLFVLDFDGDMKATAVDELREEITALLTIATPNDEVVVRLESGGGMVHSYGLAASQLSRIKEKEIPLTICVDKVAASGGYMMACVGDIVCSAPFAIIGSIGVVAQIPNFHRLLKKNDVDIELLTAGEYKRTLTMLGENTDKGRAKFIEDLEITHDLFKQFVGEQRPQVDIQTVATGEIWYGSQAKDKLLVDQVITSDAYITQQIANSLVFHLHYVRKKNFAEKVGLSVQTALESSFERIINRLTRSRFF